MSLGFAICSSPKHPEDAPVTETARFSKTHLIFFILDHLFWLVNDSHEVPRRMLESSVLSPRFLQRQHLTEP